MFGSDNVIILLFISFYCYAAGPIYSVYIRHIFHIGLIVVQDFYRDITIVENGGR